MLNYNTIESPLNRAERVDTFWYKVYSKVQAVVKLLLLKVVGLANFDLYSNLKCKIEYNVVLDQCGSKHQKRCH